MVALERKGGGEGGGGGPVAEGNGGDMMGWRKRKEIGKRLRIFWGY